jgi:hypothetical protein
MNRRLKMGCAAIFATIGVKLKREEGVFVV